MDRFGGLADLEVNLLPLDLPRPICPECMSAQQMEEREYGYECLVCGKQFNKHINRM